MSVYGLTELNDCDNVTGFTDSNKAPGLNTTVGQRYEGSGSIETQHTNTAGGDELDTTQTSGGGGTFSVDMTSRTYYFMLKDNLVDTVANQGIQALFGDGTNKVGFTIAGNDAVGMRVPPFYGIYKMDGSNLPSGNNTTYAGTEGSLAVNAITAMGMGTVHLAKAVGNVSNVFFDRCAYISNGSYALQINGGTSGTPETMADVAGDDATNGWGLIANPLGAQYVFFGPTEWGEIAASADHYFTADGEQWFWVGDNAGGQAVGAGNFPFRVVGNATDAGSFVISNVVVVNVGARATLLLDDADIDTLEIDACSFTGLGTVGCPSAGGTSRFVTDTIFSDCDQITHNGASMNGSSVLSSIVGTDVGALLYNETADPDGEMDDMAFSKGAAAHHAIDFGTAVTANITLRGVAFDGFGSTDDSNDSTVRFLAGSGSLTLSLIGCTVDGAAASSSNFSIDDAAGITVTLSIDPVTITINVQDVAQDPIQNAQVSVHLALTPFTELMNEDSTAGGVASESYAGSLPVDIVWKVRKSETTDSPRYVGRSATGEITAAGFTQTVTLEENPFLP